MVSLLTLRRLPALQRAFSGRSSMTVSKFFLDGLADASCALARPKTFDESDGIDLAVHDDSAAQLDEGEIENAANVLGVLLILTLDQHIEEPVRRAGGDGEIEPFSGLPV
jgi:hypothetical protein